jgi:hypothetical protein
LDLPARKWTASLLPQEAEAAERGEIEQVREAREEPEEKTQLWLQFRAVEEIAEQWKLRKFPLGALSVEGIAARPLRLTGRNPPFSSAATGPPQEEPIGAPRVAERAQPEELGEFPRGLRPKPQLVAEPEPDARQLFHSGEALAMPRHKKTPSLMPMITTTRMIVTTTKTNTQKSKKKKNREMRKRKRKRRRKKRTRMMNQDRLDQLSSTWLVSNLQPRQLRARAACLPSIN